MNDIANSRLDLIWTLAADEYVKELIRESRIPQANVTIDEFTENKILRMIRRDHRRTQTRKTWKVFRTLLVACLILATLALAACMTLPTVREAIWQVVLDWGDESVKINFVPPNDADSTNPAVTTVDTPANTTTTEPSDPPEPPASEPPTSIEEVNIPSYVPEKYTVQSSSMRKVYTMMYFNSTGDSVITFQQMIITSGSEGDATEGTATNVIVNGINAVLLTFEDQPNAYILYWQDHQYRYTINGYFESYADLLRMAESVAVK